jgi:diguanylate cyclase (GGDEF)-like protein/PAS domain S-box-containing protein
MSWAKMRTRTEPQPSGGPPAPSARSRDDPAGQHDLAPEDDPPLPKDPAGASSSGDGRADDADLRRLFELTGDPLAAVSLAGRFTLFNPAWEHLLGWSRGELEAVSIGELLHPDESDSALSLIGGADAEARLEGATSRFRHRDGSWHWLLWSARRDGDTSYISAKDVGERGWLGHEGLRDPLTGLPNRLLLMDRARQAFARLHRNRRVVAMLFIDLDRFKAVNDTYGHGVGDQLLMVISERLGELLRDSDTLSRLGGDEFVILVEDIESEAEALALGERVLAALEKPFALGPARVSVLASVGISASRDPTIEPEITLHEADLAMYKAKGEGGQRLRLFDEGLRRELSTHAETEVRLREALARQELCLAYQPILRLAGGHVVGCEALLRWQPAQAGGSDSDPLLPSAFLQTAEGSELIVQIGSWVLDAACAQAATWWRNGVTVPVSVNVSARELTELDLVERVREELAFHRLPPRALRIEVGEDAVLREPERARAALEDIKRLGVSVALDRFGAHQFSLGLARKVPFDTVKLDPGLTGGFAHDKDTRAMFAAAIALAKEARLNAIAVGIETNRQLALARELDCAAGQGFLLHGPVSADRLRLKYGVGTPTSAPWRPVVRLRGSSSGGARGRRR